MCLLQGYRPVSQVPRPVVDEPLSRSPMPIITLVYAQVILTEICCVLGSIDDPTTLVIEANRPPRACLEGGTKGAFPLVDFLRLPMYCCVSRWPGVPSYSISLNLGSQAGNPAWTWPLRRVEPQFVRAFDFFDHPHAASPPWINY